MKDLGKIRDRYDYSFDARQMGLVIFGVAAIAALVFVLGVSVGIQWQRKRQPEAPPQAKSQTEKLQAKAIPAAPPVLKPVTTSRAAFVPATTASAKPRTVTLTFPKVLTSAKDSVTPLVEKKVEKKQDNQAAQGHFTVQFGAYKDASAARAEVKKLTKKGYDARVYSASGRKGGYNYKVHVGTFTTKGDAAAEAKKLSASEKAASYVTKE
ncbi:MAG: SPOR domain-containing protein [Nitrospirota bacterium]